MIQRCMISWSNVKALLAVYSDLEGVVQPKNGTDTSDDE